MEQLNTIRNLYRSLSDFEVKMDKEFGINMNEAILLHNLAENGRLSSGEIASLLELMPSNTSKVIKSAESKGLIYRILGNVDKRQMYFSLTPEGHKTLEKMNGLDLKIPETKLNLIFEITKMLNSF